MALDLLSKQTLQSVFGTLPANAPAQEHPAFRW